MIFPEGTKLYITKLSAPETKVEVAGFNDLGGSIGFDGTLNSSTVLSDLNVKYGVSKRKDGGEREMSGRYEIGDEGQEELKLAATDHRQRKLEIVLPEDESGNVTTWPFEAVFAGWKLASPEDATAMMWNVKAGLNVDGQISTTPAATGE